MSGRGALDGRHALVTGAGRGIGEAIAERLHREGASVTLLGRDRGRLDAVAARLVTRVAVACADVSDGTAVRSAFSQAEERLGPVAILVNNAGAVQSAPFDRADEALWHAALATNLTGTYHGIRAVLPGMLQRNSGRIINIASTAGLRGYAYVAAYCAAKHGVIGLTRALALEVAASGVTVNAVCPGYTETDMLREAVANIRAKTGRSLDDARAAIVKANPQRRPIQPAEVAHAVAWLCLPGTESVTGQSIAVAGGEVM
jgi:NAD(P)-dependent dehydrogenase (short-subunit alcohol dehydrogenase family)